MSLELGVLEVVEQNVIISFVCTHLATKQLIPNQAIRPLLALRQ